jgi:hypothetical protein
MGGLDSDNSDVFHVSFTESRELQICLCSPTVAVGVGVSVEVFDYVCPLYIRGEILWLKFEAQPALSLRIQRCINLSCPKFLIL